MSALENLHAEHHPWYLGAMGGYGATTWQYLLPNKNNRNDATNLSTPIEVSEGGGVWGLYTGYELSNFFALEFSYLDYPTADVKFDPMSIFAFDYDERTELITQTETINLMAKFIIPVWGDQFKAFSSVGPAAIHRSDFIRDQWRATAAFNVGFMAQVTPHWKSELAVNYTAGFGQAQLNPSTTYYPFLYSGVFRLAYCF